jgi:hypothetical protein
MRVRLFREPDAGKPPVRFDEREQETESWQTGLRWWGESRTNNHRESNATAPVLDSTRPVVSNPEFPDRMLYGLFPTTTFCKPSPSSPAVCLWQSRPNEGFRRNSTFPASEIAAESRDPLS